MLIETNLRAVGRKVNDALVRKDKYGVPCPEMAKGCPARENGQDAQSITVIKRRPVYNCDPKDAQSITVIKDAQSITATKRRPVYNCDQDAQSITATEDAQSITATSRPVYNCDRRPVYNCESKVPCPETDERAFGRKAPEGAGISLKTGGQEMVLAIWHLIILIWLSLWFPVTWFYPGKFQGNLDDNKPRIPMTNPAYLAMSAKEHHAKLRTFIPVKPRREFAYPAVRGSEHIHPHAEKDPSFTSVTSGNSIANASTATEMIKHASTATAHLGAMHEHEDDNSSATFNFVSCLAKGPGANNHIVTI